MPKECGGIGHQELINRIPRKLKPAPTLLKLNDDNPTVVEVAVRNPAAAEITNKKEVEFEKVGRSNRVRQQKRLSGKALEMARAFSKKEGEKVESFEFVENGFIKFDSETKELLIIFEGRIVQYFDPEYPFFSGSAKEIVNFFKRSIGFADQPIPFDGELDFRSNKKRKGFYNTQKDNFGISSEKEFVSIVNDYFFAQRSPGFLLFSVYSKTWGYEIFVGVNLLDGLMVEYSFDSGRDSFFIDTFRRIKKDENFVGLLYTYADRDNRL